MINAGDRRPIAARNSRLIGDVAGWLIRRGASPDAISVAGMVAACLAGLVFAGTPGQPRALWLLGALFVQARLLANLLDGMVAIGRNVASSTGELFNEIPDRVSDTAVLAGLGVAAGSVAWGLAAALAAMATAYVRAVGRGLGLPSDFRGPMAKQHRMAVVTTLAVVCAVWRDGAATLVLATLWAITALSVWTACRRLLGVARALRP